MAAEPRPQRIRNHAAERERRNARAREAGYSSRDVLGKARRRGEAPTAAQLRTDAAARERAEILARERGYAGRNVVETRAPRTRRDDYLIAGFKTDADYQRARRESQEWSDAHSRVPVSRYDPNMSPTRFRAYYRAFVAEWGLKRSLAWQRYLKRYIVNITKTKTETDYDIDNRYPS